MIMMIIMYMMRATNNKYKNDNDNQDRNMYFVQSRIYSRAWLCRTSAMRKKKMVRKIYVFEAQKDVSKFKSIFKYYILEIKKLENINY